MVEALEDLVMEEQLPARLARQIEEAVLVQTHWTGLWL
jgi:hypothetical protein